MAQLAGAHALSWAVGAYLPVSTTAPIWVGGLLKGLVLRLGSRSASPTLRSNGDGAQASDEIGPGMLYATGLVAGGSIAGIAIALLLGFARPLAKTLNLGHDYFARLGISGDIIGFAAFGGLCLLLLHHARAPERER
jgi:hypothetical protein